MKYNISAKSSIDAIGICNTISNNKGKFGISKIYSTGRIVIIEFVNNVISNKSLRMINKLIK